MIEVKVREHDAVDVRVGEACLLKVVEQRVPLLLNAEPVAKLWWEERADASLEKDLAIAVLDQQRSAGKGDAVELIGLDPLSPECSRRVSEHGAAIKAL